MWAGFVRLEGLLKAETRTQIASWVSGSQQRDGDSRWPATFGVVFDRVFTEKHQSWGCVWRSSVASLLAVVVMTAVLYMVNSGVRRGFDGAGLARLLEIGILAGIFNLFPDYLSLLETRLVLRRMAKGSAGAFRLFGWLIFDAVVTVGIFAMAWLVLTVFVASSEVKHVEVMLNGLLSLFGVESLEAGLGIYLYSTFFNI